MSFPPRCSNRVTAAGLQVLEVRLVPAIFLLPHVRRHFVNVFSTKPTEEQRGGRSLRGKRLLWLRCDDDDGVSLTSSLPPLGRLGRRGREAASPLLLLLCHPVSPLKGKRSQLACAEAEERQLTSTLKPSAKKKTTPGLRRRSVARISAQVWDYKPAAMSPFLRIGFSNFEMDPGLAYHEEVLNPYCAVYMKEAIDTGQFRR